MLKRWPSFLALLLVCGAAGRLEAQGSASPVLTPSSDAWNAERAVELVRRAQLLRAQTQIDTALLSYQADARGYVYFYLDRQDTGERNLVKTDQVALEVYWRAPDRVKQRIVGWRDAKSLPTNIRYHIDHLAVVHDNFGDLIRIGDGDEVRDVLHPAAPGAQGFYDYRLADSLTLRLPGLPEPVRVYELNVRPRDLAQPGLIGSIFIDRRSGALVRMDFTFTPSSYVDRNLDYINISLDNGLWLERFWLPNRQRVEIRRQIPELDIPAGSVIRGTMRVQNYRFNELLPDWVFFGAPVSVVPQAEREAFPFEEDLYAELRAEGIGPGSELGEIRRQAVALARQRALSGLPGTRLRLGAASELLRYNRAEGAAFSLGLSRAPTGSTTLAGRAGWALGPQHPLAQLELTWRPAPVQLEAGGYFNTPREVGGEPVASGVINTLSALFAGRDFSDLYYARGGALGARWRATPEWTLGAALRAEAQRSASLETEFSFFGPEELRPVRPIDDGTLYGATVSLQRTAPAEAVQGWSGSLRADLSALSLGAQDQAGAGPSAPAGPSDPRFARLRADLGWSRRWGPGNAALELGGAAGRAWGELPRQELFLLGGRGTVPGYEFRAYGGDRFARAGALFSTDLASPWLRARLHADAGWADVGSAGARSLPLWGARPTGSVRPSLGAGMGFFFDILRLDVFRGLGADGRWEFLIETRRSFWDFL